MPITVLSPYSGRAVKARDQDIGRALRDEEGRIFYIVERPDGNGFYAAPTRKGSDKDLARYDALETKGETARQTHHEQSEAQVSPAHDARGKGRKASPVRLLILLIALALLAAAGYFAAIEFGLLPINEPTPADDTPAETTSIDANPADDIAVADPRVPTIDDSVAVEPQTTVDETGASKPTRQLGAAGFVGRRLDVATPSLEEGWTERASGLRYRVLEPGFGDRAQAGGFVTVEYEVRLATGTVIDSSKANGPMRFVLWSGQAMRAWDEAVTGMQIGEKREVVIPPALLETGDDALGAVGVDGLRLRATVELLSVRDGVEIEVVDAGQTGGRTVMPGDRVELDYQARVKDADRTFATSDSLGEPLRFVVGNGDVVPGLDLGVAGMAVGERRRVTIPPYLAYGRRGIGRLIPPDATLIYDVTLRRVVDDP